MRAPFYDIQNMQRIQPFSQFINESRSKYDSLSRQLVRQCMFEWVEAWNKNKKKHAFYNSVNDTRSGLIFDLKCDITFRGTGFAVLDGTGADDTPKSFDDDPMIFINFRVDPDWLPGYWSEIYMHLSDVMRHEIEHISQGGADWGNYKTGKPYEDDAVLRDMIHAKVLPKHMYLLLPKEIDANLQGLRYEAKKRKRPMSDIVNQYLDTQDYLTNQTRDQVLTAWRDRAKKIGGIPEF